MMLGRSLNQCIVLRQGRLTYSKVRILTRMATQIVHVCNARQ